jgi:hypothetical protein
VYHQRKKIGISSDALLAAGVEGAEAGGERIRYLRWLRPVLLAYLPLLVCIALTLLAADIDRSSFNEVVLLPPERIGAFRFFIGLLAYLAGYFAVYFVPGFLLMRALRIDLANGVSNAIAAFTLSLAGVALAWIATMAIITGEGNRVSFFVTVALLEAITLVTLWVRNTLSQPLSHSGIVNRIGRDFLIPVIGIAIMLTLAWLLMPGKLTLETFEGDATEAYGFAASLFHGGLPKWDLEVGIWGFYPTVMFFPYPVFFSIALGGTSEAAVRLPALLFFGILVLAMAELAGRGKARDAGGSLRILLPILVVGFISLQVGAYYSGSDPFHGDLGAAPVEDWIATALAVCAVVLVRDGASGLGAITAFLSFVAYLSGPMLVAIFGGVGLLVGTASERKCLIRSGLILLGLVLGYAIFFVIYTMAQGTFSPTIKNWLSLYLAGRVGLENPMRILHALGWYVLLSGGLPVLGYGVALYSKDSMARWLALAGLLWIGVFLLSPSKEIHYFMPAALIPVVLAVRVGLKLKFGPQTAGEKEKREETNNGGHALVWTTLLTLSGIVVIILSWPTAIPPYTADRDFGRTTVFLASTEREAVEDSQVIYNILKPLSRCNGGNSWTIGHHAWVRYADRTLQPSKLYEFYVGRGKPPLERLEEISRTKLSNGGYAILWTRNTGFTSKLIERCFPIRKDLSRFNFDLDTYAAN